MNRVLQRLDQLLQRPVRWFAALSAATQDRLVGITLFLPAAAVLAVALYLTPSPTGLGTHRQLGLGNCAILAATGYPCPMCGMTTTFTHLAHLHLLQGTLNQPFGLVLFSLTVAAAVLGAAELVRPARRWRAVLRWLDRRENIVAWSLLGGLFLGWAYKIVLVRGIPPW